MMYITKEQIEARLIALNNSREAVSRRLITIEGAIVDCRYWLREIEKIEAEARRKVAEADAEARNTLEEAGADTDAGQGDSGQVEQPAPAEVEHLNGAEATAASGLPQ